MAAPRPGLGGKVAGREAGFEERREHVGRDPAEAQHRPRLVERARAGRSSAPSASARIPRTRSRPGAGAARRRAAPARRCRRRSAPTSWNSSSATTRRRPLSSASLPGSANTSVGEAGDVARGARAGERHVQVARSPAPGLLSPRADLGRARISGRRDRGGGRATSARQRLRAPAATSARVNPSRNAT